MRNSLKKKEIIYWEKTVYNTLVSDFFNFNYAMKVSFAGGIF